MLDDRDPPQVRRSLPEGKLCLQSQRPVNCKRRNSHPGSPWHRSSRCSHPKPRVPGGHCHSGKDGSKPARILAVYLLPSRPLLDAYLTACLPVLIAGDPNAKHLECNSRVVTRRGRLLRECADKNSCLIHGPNSPHCSTV
jgi:hypothetical protein